MRARRIEQTDVRSTGNGSKREREREKEMRAAEALSLSRPAEVNAISSVRPLSQWHAPITLTG